MTTFRQLETNRRNAEQSTGPRTDAGRRRSRLNAIRHGLMAETVVASLEDAEDYKAFEATIIADYCPETAVARELVLRLASLLWRLRRATAIETSLLQIQAHDLSGCEPALPATNQFTLDAPQPHDSECTKKHQQLLPNRDEQDYARAIRQLAYCFLHLAKLDSAAFERLNRYELALWRQTVQILFALEPIKQR
jgi:hypothetical protein